MNNIPILLVFLCLMFTASCVSTKKAIYFDNIQDAEIITKVDDLEPIIQKNDILSITVNSLNPEASQIFNLPNNSEAEVVSTTGRPIQITGYLVDQDGTIDFPVLGRIHAEGLKKSELKELILKSIIDQKLLMGPIVNVRYLNFRIIVIGEVSRPTVVIVPSEKITLLEALGFAGDLTVFAKRENVMIIREEENGGENKRIIKRLNLNSQELFTSPYYYLKSNDIVYVEPNNAKISSASTPRLWLPVIFSGLTVILVAVNMFVVN
jgi:polysaccharide biosynthesis/export protein